MTVELTLRRHPMPRQRVYRDSAGEVIPTSADPEASACRALEARGIFGLLVFGRMPDGTLGTRVLNTAAAEPVLRLAPEFASMNGGQP